ncbi:MAG: DUF3078 domain-containing protein [Flavobacteriales bacterium]|nr:DUF3078 domain-containing protein [Flavobacteriales bacterium]
MVTTTMATQEEAPADTTWKKGGTFGLNFSQTYLENWAAGGQSSISGTGLLSLFGNYAKGKHTWDNSLDLAYGLLRQGEAGGIIKTDDRIDLSSKYGYKANEKWYYSGLLNFRTQFAPGYTIVDGAETDDLISDFLAPAYLLGAAGMDYKPNDDFTVFISPATYKMTIVMNDSLASVGAFGVDEGSNIRSEIGGFLKVQYKTELVENVSLQTRIDLFSNYLNNPQNIDVNWETLISMKINEYLTTTISTQLLYDDDIDIIAREAELDADGNVVRAADVGPRVQFKEVLAIGFSYKF